MGQADGDREWDAAHAPADVVTPWYAAVHAHDVVVPGAEALACVVAQGEVEEQATPLRHEVPVHLHTPTPRGTRGASAHRHQLQVRPLECLPFIVHPAGSELI